MKSCCWRADTGLWDLDQPISPVQAPMGCLQSLAEMFWTVRDVGPCQRPLNACSKALYVGRSANACDNSIWVTVILTIDLDQAKRGEDRDHGAVATGVYV